VAWGPAVWEVWEVWYLKVTYGHLGRARGAWWIHFFFCFEGLMIDFSSHGEDTNFYIETDVFFKDHRTWRLLVSHESCHRPIHHECSHHNIIFRGGFSFFPVQLLKITELGFPAHPQIRIHTGIQLALVQLESIQNLGIFPR
jgi:hypothetical protein